MRSFCPKTFSIRSDGILVISFLTFLFNFREFYTIDELLAKPPPQGVDPTKLEKYLSEEDFLVRSLTL